MDREMADRVAGVYAAQIVSGHSSDREVAAFLGLPVWVDGVRHPDVVLLEEAVTQLVVRLLAG